MRKMCISTILFFFISVATIHANGGDILPIVGVKPEKSEHAIIAGVAMDKFGIVKVSEYVLLDPNTLVIYGVNKGSDKLLLVIDLEKQVSTELNKYSMGKIAIPQGHLVAFNNEAKPPMLGFVFIYDVNLAGGRIYEETDTYVESFISVEGKTLHAAGSEKVAEARIEHVIKTDPKKNKYRYEAPDGGPARKIMSKLYFRDVNHDGYIDILVWRKKYMSRIITDKGKDDFMAESEEVQVMYYNQKSASFTPMVKTDKLLFGKDDLWKILPPMNYFDVPL